MQPASILLLQASEGHAGPPGELCFPSLGSGSTLWVDGFVMFSYGDHNGTLSLCGDRG